MSDGLYRRTILVGEDRQNGRTRYFYGWAQVTFYPDDSGRVGSTVLEWKDPPQGSDHYPSDRDFAVPVEPPAHPLALDGGPLVIEAAP